MPEHDNLDIVVKYGDAIESVSINQPGVEKLYPGMTDQEIVERIQEWIRQTAIREAIMTRLVGPLTDEFYAQHVSEAT